MVFLAGKSHTYGHIRCTYTVLANPTHALVTLADVVALSCRLVSVHAQGKAKVVASGLLPLLLKMLHCSPYGAHTEAASQGLYAVTLGEVDLQNEVAAQVCVYVCVCACACVCVCVRVYVCVCVCWGEGGSAHVCV